MAGWLPRLALVMSGSYSSVEKCLHCSSVPTTAVSARTCVCVRASQREKRENRDGESDAVSDKVCVCVFVFACQREKDVGRKFEPTA